MGKVDRATRDHLSEAIAVAVRSGFGRDKELLREIAQRVEDELGEPDEALVAELAGEARRLLEEQRALEASWTVATTNDAIDRAFAELDASGIVALQNAGYTMSDGWSDVNEIATERASKRGAPRPRGATFYHGQDLERGVEGKGLLLAFGAYVEGARHDAASVAVAREICQVLGRHGVKTKWDGKVGSRIAIAPFTWQKRRWTRAPRSDGASAGEAGPGGGALPGGAKASRRLTCTEGGASKFWEGSVAGASLTVHYGRIGTTGQVKVKKLPTAADAEKELARLVKEKLGKGYVG